MNEVGGWGAAVLTAINLLILAAAWGDMRRQVQDNRERQDDRHRENTFILRDISQDVKRINGMVARHEEQLGDHERRLGRRD